MKARASSVQLMSVQIKSDKVELDVTGYIAWLTRNVLQCYSVTVLQCYSVTVNNN